MRKRKLAAIWVTAVVLTVTSCGTTYELPSISAEQTSRAKQLFAEGQAQAARAPMSAAAAERRFNRVRAKIMPTGKAVCEAATADRSNFDCDVTVEIDREMKSRNAYFTYGKSGPVIRLSLPLLRDSANDDEVAFVMGHEYGHLIGRHIDKQQQQALAGALILGTLAAAAGASNGNSYDPLLVESSMALGAAAGGMAYSQAYELESDTLGTRIAYMAGYDPVAGARYFARPEGDRMDTGKLSFWGTHPPDEKRVATVLATVAQIEAQQALQKK